MTNAQINTLWFKLNDRIVALLIARAGTSNKAEQSRLEFLIDGLRARRHTLVGRRTAQSAQAPPRPAQ